MKFLSLMCALFLFGCAGIPMTPEMQARYDRSIVCSNVMNAFSGDEYMYRFNQCNDHWEDFNSDLPKIASKAKPIKLCYLSRSNIEDVTKIVKKRGVNCSEVFRFDQIKKIRASVPQMSNLELCKAQTSGNFLKDVLPNVKKEIRSRDVDCQLVLMLDIQQKQLQIQQQAAEAAAEQSRRQAIANALQNMNNQMQIQQIQQQNNFYHQQMLNNINRPVQTNCYRFGNNVNCTSY